MNKLLILGAGTAGTMVANKLRHRLPADEWTITIVDQDTAHHYQPGYLFIPFGEYTPNEVVKPRQRFIPDGVDFVLGEIDRVEPDDSQVVLADGSTLQYDQLVIATGTTPRPEETPGFDSDEWAKSIHTFYTLEGATALRDALDSFSGGRLVMHIVDYPFKCPVAPLEFIFLADSYFRDKGMRDQVELIYVTPNDGAFTKPVASRHLGGMFDERKIALEADYYTERVDPDTRTLVSYDEREIPFDLLVTVPLNMGADFIGRSGLGNELNYVPVDKHTFLSTDYDNVFALGDAADIPTSKAGSVAHFEVDVFADNFLRHIQGKEMTEKFDGHANCFIESGAGKALLIDFNYDVEPLPGKYPLPGFGPLSLLEETEINHWGKLMFRWIYWNMLLPGKDLPVPALMSMLGKEVEEVEA